VLLVTSAAMPQEPAGQAVDRVLGNWGLPGAVVALAVLLYLVPGISARWRGKDPDQNLTAVLAQLNETLVQIQIRLNQTATSAEVQAVGEKNRHAIPGQLQPVMDAIGRVEQAVTRETAALATIIKERTPGPGGGR